MIQLRAFSGTHVGQVRDHNEDSIFLPDEDKLIIVADGMGGHASGEIASQVAVDVVVEHFRDTVHQQVLTWPYKVDRDVRTHVNRMTTGIMLANLEIWHRIFLEGERALPVNRAA